MTANSSISDANRPPGMATVSTKDASDAATHAGGTPQPPAIFRVQGAMSIFGGPHDTGMTPSEGLALFDTADLHDPRHRDLFLPSPPPGTSGLGRRLNPQQYYLACRWNYQVTSRHFLRTTVALVQSVRTGRVQEAKPVDWGPNAHTGRVADLSPGLAAALELETDDHVVVSIRARDSTSGRPDESQPGRTQEIAI